MSPLLQAVYMACLLQIVLTLQTTASSLNLHSIIMDVEKNATPDVDETLIDFDGPNDPYMPLNWPLKKKLTTTILYSACSFGTMFASSMFVPVLAFELSCH